jgi:hypothetical protein
MAASKKVPITKKKFNLSNPKIALAVIFVIAFGSLGVYKLLSSSAATGPTRIYYQDYTRISNTSTSVAVADDSYDFASTGKVAKLSSGGTLNYDPPMTSITTKACYVMRVPGDGFGGGRSATVEIGVQGNKKRLTIQPTKYYREYCVLAADDPNAFQGNVKHISGDPIFIRHMSMYIAVPVQYQILGRSEGLACTKQGYTHTCSGSISIQRPQKPETAKTIQLNEGTQIDTDYADDQKITQLTSGDLPMDAEILFFNDRPVQVWLK